MRIIICDDIQKDRKTIRAALDTYAAAHPEYHVEIDEYNAAADVLRRMEKEAYDIALMDICMPGVPGTDAAEEMLAKYPEIIKIGASYVINSDFVRSISGNNIEMQGGAKIPVPRRSVEEVQRVYMEYCRKEAIK